MHYLSIHHFFKENRLLFFSYLILLLIGVIVLVMGGVHAEILYFQAHHNLVLDWFFYLLTVIFEFPFILLFLGLVIFWFRDKLILLLATYGLASITTQILKRVFAHPRPAQYFEVERQTELYSFLRQMGEELPRFNGFPSGHTTVAFALLSMLAFVMPKKYQHFFLLIAGLIGVSRVYLACHFLEDIIAGSLVGVVSSVIVVLLASKGYLNLKKNKSL